MTQIFDPNPILPFGLSADAIFATLTTLLVLAVTSIGTLAYSRLRSWRYDIDLRVLLRLYLTEVLRLVDLRITGHAALGDINSSHKGHFVYSEVAIPTDYFTTLSQYDLFRAIRRLWKKSKRERLEIFAGLVSTLSALNSHDTTAKTQFEYFTKRESEFMRIYVDAANEIVSLQRTQVVLARNLNVPPSQDPFLAKWNSIVNEWSLVPNRDDAEIVMERLIVPTRVLCAEFQSDARRLELLSAINRAENAKTNRDSLLDLFGQYFRDEVNKYQKHRDRLHAGIKLLG